MLSEINQTEKDKYCNITYMCNLKKLLNSWDYGMVVAKWAGGCVGRG